MTCRPNSTGAPAETQQEAPGDVVAPTIGSALDFIRLDEIARLAALAASYWHSIELAADRGDVLTLRVHIHQVTQVTRETLTAGEDLEVRAVSADPAVVRAKAEREYLRSRSSETLQRRRPPRLSQAPRLPGQLPQSSDRSAQRMVRRLESRSLRPRPT